MLAAVLNESKSILDLDEVPVPETGENDVLVRIQASGVCGSDLRIIRGTIPLPRYLELLPKIQSSLLYKNICTLKSRYWLTYASSAKPYP